MKSTINRFLAISVVLITALAFVNGDCQQKAQASTTDQSDQAEYAMVSQNNLDQTDQTKSEEPKELFRFPNVFDVFRSIF